jgi:hypothetical protein
MEFERGGEFWDGSIAATVEFGDRSDDGEQRMEYGGY